MRGSFETVAKAVLKGAFIDICFLRTYTLFGSGPIYSRIYRQFSGGVYAATA